MYHFIVHLKENYIFKTILLNSSHYPAPKKCFIHRIDKIQSLTSEPSKRGKEMNEEEK